MNLPKSPFHLPLFSFLIEKNTDTDKPIVGPASNFSIFKRLLNLSLVVIGLTICINLWLAHNKQEKQWYQQQANQLGRSLAVLSAQAIADGITSQDEQIISQQINFLMSDQYVLGVSIYTHKGQLLQQQDTIPTIVERYIDSNENPLTFIQEIRSSDGELLGFLRIIIDEKKVMQFHFDYQQQMIEQFEVLLLLAAIAGGIITRAFYTIRYRQYRRKLKEGLNSLDIL